MVYDEDHAGGADAFVQLGLVASRCFVDKEIVADLEQALEVVFNHINDPTNNALPSQNPVEIINILGVARDEENYFPPQLTGM